MVDRISYQHFMIFSCLSGGLIFAFTKAVWLVAIQAEAFLAYSIFVYKLTNNYTALEQLAELFQSIGNIYQANLLNTYIKEHL